MTNLNFELQGFMIDNDPGWARARFHLVRESLLHCELVEEDAPFPIYAWSLDDASIVGHGILEEGDVAKVFAVALSMQSWRFLHSPVIVRAVSSPRFTPSGQVGRPTIGMTSPLITIDERHFMGAAKGIASFWTTTGWRGSMLRASVNAYWDAVQSVRTRPRFLNLWAALELMVRASGERAKGQLLDRQIASMTGGRPEDIEPLRHLNNRLKHGRVEEPALFVGGESGALKRGVDRAFAKDRFALPPTYDNGTVLAQVGLGGQLSPTGHVKTSGS